MSKFASILIIILMIMSLSSCQNASRINNDNAPESEPEIVVLKVMHRWPPDTGNMGEITQKILDDFDALHEDITIQVDSVPSSMYEAQLNVRLASDNGPDLYYIWPGGRTEAQLRKGDIADITHLWEENNWYEVVTPGIIEGSRHTDGRMYSFPLENKPNTFWYNVEIFEEVGAKVPTTWAELMEVARLCKESAYTPFSVGGNLTRWMPAFWFDYILLNTAGGEFRERLMWGEESWESEEVYEAFEIWKEAIDLGYFNDDVSEIDYRQATDKVAKGQAAMMLLGPWAINDFMSDDYRLIPEEEFDTFAFPQINPNVPQAAEGAIISLGINPNGNATEAAELLLVYFAEKEQVTYIAQTRNSLGSRKDISFDIYSDETRGLLERQYEQTSENPLYMNFELATLPAMQDVGMNAIIEFMETPDSYKEICAQVEAVSRATFDQTN